MLANEINTIKTTIIQPEIKLIINCLWKINNKKIKTFKIKFEWQFMTQVLTLHCSFKF